MRAYLDLIAYGSHYPTCRLHETVATNRPHLPDLHPHPCSCGFKDAVDKAQRAAQPAPDPEAIRLLRKLLNAIEDSNITPNKGAWDNLDNTADEARSFLRARESGGEP